MPPYATGPTETSLVVDPFSGHRASLDMCKVSNEEGSAQKAGPLAIKFPYKYRLSPKENKEFSFEKIVE